MSKEHLEALDRMSVHRFDDKYEEWDADYAIVESYLEEKDDVKPSEAMVCLKELKDIVSVYGDSSHIIEPIKQVLLRAQEKEKDKVFLKNLHNTKVKVPLVDIFNGLPREKREAYTEHLYYHWQEMKESLEAKIESIKTEKENLESKLRKQARVLRIILNNIELDKNYNEQGSGSTKAYKLTIPNCISMEEDENYTDDCYPNSDFETIDNFIKEENI